jgi:chromosomal replication initiator protein
MQGGIEREIAGELPFSATFVGGDDVAASNDAEQKFERVKAQLKARLGAEVYSSWFGRMKVAEASRGIIRISVPTAFLRSWINGHYLELIAELWRHEDPDVLKIEIVVRTATRQGRNHVEPEIVPARKMTRQTHTALANGTASAGRVEQRAPAPRQGASVEPEFRHNVLGSPLDPRYTFASFIEGPSNRVAFAAARAVAESQSSAVRFNPLFLHATVGLGKTHLLQAIAAESLRHNPKSRVVYLTAEYFMWRFATAIRDNNALTLKEQLRDIDLLIIDDMQFLQGKSIQHEFCHLINMLLDSAKQVVVAADRPPSELV